MAQRSGSLTRREVVVAGLASVPRGKGAEVLSPHCTCRPEEGPCPVRWVESSRRFICPCHGGVYDEEGAVVAAARRRLKRLPASVEGGIVFVGRQS